MLCYAERFQTNTNQETESVQDSLLCKQRENCLGEGVRGGAGLVLKGIQKVQLWEQTVLDVVRGWQIGFSKSWIAKWSKITKFQKNRVCRSTCEKAGLLYCSGRLVNEEQVERQSSR